MAPRRKHSLDGLPSQHPAVTRPENPTLTLPDRETNSTGLYSYYPETQRRGMKSSMRPRGGFVDRSLAQILGREVGFVAAQHPSKYILEPDSIDSASENVITDSSKEHVLPRWNDLSAREREDEEQQEKQRIEDRHLRRHSYHKTQPNSLEHSMKLDTDTGLVQINDAKESHGISGDESPNEGEPATRNSLGHRFNIQGFTGTAQRTNTGIQSLFPAAEPSSQHELSGIDSLTHTTTARENQHRLLPLRFSSALASPTARDPPLSKALFCNPLLWLSVLGILFFSHRLHRDCVAQKQNRGHQKRPRRGPPPPSGRRAGGGGSGERDEKCTLRDEETAARAAAAQAQDSGRFPAETMPAGRHEHVCAFWESTSAYCDSEYDDARIVEMEMVIVTAAFEDLFPGAEAGPEECAG